MPLPVLDEQPDLLAPRAALLRRRAAARLGDEPLVVSAAWRLASGEGDWVEVVDSLRKTTMRFALTRASREMLGRLVPGEAPPPLDPTTEVVLVDAGILVAAGDDAEAEVDSQAAARASFAADRFAVVPDAWHPYQLAGLRRYVRAGIRAGRFPLGDTDVTRRYHAHNDPVSRTCQADLLPLVASIVGVAIKPSYVYLSAYIAGSVLPPHRDRPQCRYTVSLQVDYAPEPTLESGWPLRLLLGDAEVTVYQSLGDALIFAGCEHSHFRTALPPGHLSTSILLHYVDADFEGPLE